jgi:hypothetical protein
MRNFRREIPVQLNASHSRGLRSLPNFIDVAVNENTDRVSFSWKSLDNFQANAGFNVARASRIEVKPNQRRAKLHARFGVFRVRDAADFDLYRNHRENDEARMTNDELMAKPE